MMRAKRDYDLVIEDFAEGESKVYGINWTGWLDGANITSSEIEADQGLTATHVSNTATVQRFRLEDGRAGTNYSLVATVNTSTGDTLKCSLLVVCRLP